MDYEDTLDKEFFQKKYPFQITQDDDSNFIRRFEHAKKEHDFYINNKEIFNICLKSNNAYDLCEKIETFILPKLKVMPTFPDRIPGPLSDEDIVYMAFQRKKDEFIVERNGIKLTEEELRNIISGCGMHITLSNDIRKVKGNIFDNYINMSLDQRNMKDKLVKMYPLISIATGYVLEPNEVILCSSNEKIYIPKDIYAIVASRFSYAQLGLSIELGTSVIQAGHYGKIHFQIKNNTKNFICIYPDISVAQILFFRTVHPSSKSYNDLMDVHLYDADSTPPLSKYRENML